MKFTSGAMMIGNSPSSKEKATRRPIMKATAVVPISLHFSIRLVRNFILNEKYGDLVDETPLLKLQ